MGFIRPISAIEFASLSIKSGRFGTCLSSDTLIAIIPMFSMLCVTCILISVSEKKGRILALPLGLTALWMAGR
jgi:hypothetical protein